MGDTVTNQQIDKDNDKNINNVSDGEELEKEVPEDESERQNLSNPQSCLKVSVSNEISTDSSWSCYEDGFTDSMEEYFLQKEIKRKKLDKKQTNRQLREKKRALIYGSDSDADSHMEDGVDTDTIHYVSPAGNNDSAASSHYDASGSDSSDSDSRVKISNEFDALDSKVEHPVSAIDYSGVYSREFDSKQDSASHSRLELKSRRKRRRTAGLSCNLKDRRNFGPAFKASQLTERLNLLSDTYEPKLRPWLESSSPSLPPSSPELETELKCETTNKPESTVENYSISDSLDYDSLPDNVYDSDSRELEFRGQEKDSKEDSKELHCLLKHNSSIVEFQELQTMDLYDDSTLDSRESNSMVREHCSKTDNQKLRSKQKYGDFSMNSRTVDSILPGAWHKTDSIELQSTHQGDDFSMDSRDLDSILPDNCYRTDSQEVQSMHQDCSNVASQKLLQSLLKEDDSTVGSQEPQSVNQNDDSSMESVESESSLLFKFTEPELGELNSQVVDDCSANNLQELRSILLHDDTAENKILKKILKEL